ncbi:prepilin peptidase [Gordonia sp. CPCC 206044]|uniref:prepilin peptidase n=1 Tax=Gordonia sp. CPCC 206044 TaxID=3140793 RepID=UPI003AF37EA8
MTTFACPMFVVPVWLAVIAITDRRTGRIPTALVWPGVAAVAAYAAVHPVVAVAAFVTAMPYLGAALARSCGGGDVKLAFAVGGIVADPGVCLCVVLLAAVLSLITHAVGASVPRARPHGPALIIATICGLALT